MTTATIFATVLLMGFSCSIGCGAISTPFILGSLLADSGTITQSRRAVFVFSIGKVISLIVMGLLSAIFGSILLSYIEVLYPNATVWVIKIATILFGGKILYTTLKNDFTTQEDVDTKSIDITRNNITQIKYENSYANFGDMNNMTTTSNCASNTTKSGCGGCKSKSKCGVIPQEILTEEKIPKSYFLAGLLYATIPCGPLVTCLTYASTMNPVLAMLLLGLFGIVNSILPVIFLSHIVGMANTEFKTKSIGMIKYIKLSGGLILIYAALFKV